MTAVVRFDQAGLTYPGPPPVVGLRPADLTVEAAEYVTVVGPSGAGKSTFLNVVGLLDRVTTGRYELDGIDVATLSESARTALRASRIGFVFQAFHLLAQRSALENVTLGQLYTGHGRAVRRRNAAEMLDRVGLAHRLHALPSTLSGGERQRVAIARALVNRPKLLLCDEPTGNLDSATAGSVLRILDDLQSDGFTLIVITHDPAVAARGTRRISILDGEIHE
ncbi:MAG: ABC transporter ATP-binding protein [Glycomyces artemisiae]|uniref:ABC transporter ATP-binding protein n=1 Tax=Glycomyces artemisiae TaxID=1076443 RepID=A0A850CEI7_9ACTN|nr:ABC transporter ATP-binding protein [Glycomyces artemisiae]NUR31427.1 ABC transporter ATP-binding protein [Catenulispora sp.]